MGRKNKTAAQSSPHTPEGSVETHGTQKNLNLGPMNSSVEEQSPTMDAPLDPQNVMIYSPLVHPSAGMVPVGVHNTILAYRRALSLDGSHGNPIDPLRLNEGDPGFQPPRQHPVGSGVMDTEVGERVRELAKQLEETLVQSNQISGSVQPQQGGVAAPTAPTWSSLFQRSPLTGKGDSLSFVAPAAEGGSGFSD